ncbi:MAG TPA: Ig-like domain-containing protein [Gemmatimonadales bacterium]|nr:Ig-like domain-containing protein [Gemmatimonadales bacterium]
MRRYTVLLSLLFVLALEGCSLLFTKGPPVGHEQMQYFTCSESNTAPVIDLVIGGLDLIGGFAIASDPEAYGYAEDQGGSAIALGVVQAAFLGVSAGIGFDRVKKCQAAKAAWAARQAHPAPSAAAPGMAIDSVSISPATVRAKVGEVVQVTAVAYGGGRAVAPQPAFKWSSSNDAIAWVTPSGLVSPLAPGTVVIAANAGSIVGVMTIVVTSAP